MINIIIADDHPLMRDALLACIEDEEDLNVVAEVMNGRDAVMKATSQEANVVILDLYLPDMDGLQVMEEILIMRPETRILIFTSSMDEDRIAQALQAGALGYMIKDSPRVEIVQAIREVSQGRSFLSTTAAGKLANVFRHRQSANDSTFIKPLTQREEDNLSLISTGASNSEIASTLHIEETTVRTHISHLLRKMGLKNRSELLMYLLQQKQKQ